MNREIALLFVICILLGSVQVLHSGQDNPQELQGTRAVNPGLPVKENITNDETWGDDPAWPYINVQKDIWVMEGATLTILPSTRILFNPGCGLHIKGRVNATGSYYNRISFLPFTDPPATMDWKGITLENSTQHSVFNYVDIEYSEVGIGAWNSPATIMNSTVEFTFFYGILCGEDSRLTVKNNYVNFTTWAGIICDNRSQAIVRENRVKTSYYGIVCYDESEVILNKIETCWLGILGWGDANITLNEVRDCMDGIHGFYADPRIEGNLIVSCDGNGTRFIKSNAIVKDNNMVSNYVGMDLDYDSRHMLARMDNNKVNGIEVEDCFYVGVENLVIDSLSIDSGWSKGYYGSLTAQGSVTLYDCTNVTINECTITNTANSIFATNSSFVIYNSTLGNVRNAQVYLDANASGTGFDGSVDPEKVSIGGLNCLFQTYEDMQVQVFDYYGVPIDGARVTVSESQLILFDILTNISGITPVMIVKDRTVSESGVISSPLSVQVQAAGYNFDQNPRTGIHAVDTPLVTFNDLGDVLPPMILNVSVMDGDRMFPVDGTITIIFSEEMNHTSVEEAFSISGNVTGTFSWNGFNLTFTPDFLEYSTPYTVLISADATDAWGNSMDSPMSVSFTTVKAPSTGNQVVFIAVIAIFAIAGIVGWFVLRKLN